MMETAGVEATELSLAGLLKATVNRQSPDKDQTDVLNSIIVELRREAKTNHWFFEDGVMPGQWVYFEAPLNDARVPLPALRSTIFFADVTSGVENYPTREGTRFLLHGSIEHARRTNVPVVSLNEMSGRCWSSSDIFYMLNSLGPELDKIDIRQPKHAIQKRRLTNVFQVLLNFLDSTYEPHATEWMSGHAKITMIGNSSELHIGGDGSVEIIENNRFSCCNTSLCAKYARVT